MSLPLSFLTLVLQSDDPILQLEYLLLQATQHLRLGIGQPLYLAIVRVMVSHHAPWHAHHGAVGRYILQYYCPGSYPRPVADSDGPQNLGPHTDDDTVP